MKKSKIKNKIFYVTDEKNSTYVTNSSDKRIINLEKDLLGKFNFVYFLKNFYLTFFIKKINFIKIGIQYPIFLNVINKSLNNIINWKLFYILYETKFHLNAMSDEKIFIKNTHNQNNVKTIFLYFSTTEELISRPRRKGFT